MPELGSTPPQIHRISLSPIVMDPRFAVVRRSSRHQLSRQEGFEDLFDYLTLFYDVFWSFDDEHVIALGPPFPSQIDPHADLTITSFPKDEKVPFQYFPSKFSPLPCFLCILAPTGTRALKFRLAEQEWICPIQPNLSRLFSGSTSLVTISQNNDLQWIHDWAFFHVNEYDVDTIVFYDNSSTKYESGEIELALCAVNGLKDIVVIPQEAPYGPPAYWDGGGPGDGLLLQPAMLEHARRRILGLADLFISLDVDELLLLKTGGHLRYYLDRDEPVALIYRQDIANFTRGSDSDAPRHRHYWWKYRGCIQPKWIAQPRRCPFDAVFSIHHVDQAESWQCPEDELVIGHFLGLTTGWQDPTRLVKLLEQQAETLVEDVDLRDCLARVFESGPAPYRSWSPLDSGEADLMLRSARQLAREGRLPEALDAINQCLALEPDHLGGLVLLRQVHERLGNVLETKEASDHINRLTTFNPDWYVRRASFMRTTSLSHAIEVLETAVNLGVQSSDLLSLLSELREQEGSGSHLQASPNPVPAGTGFGATTITWDTGDGVSGEVYVSVSDQGEKLFARASEGSEEASWIQSGETYCFRLYAGSEHTRLLSAVTVTRSEGPR